MKVELAYGKSGLVVEFPNKLTTVIEPTYVPGAPDERGAVLNAIRNPIEAVPPRQAFRRDQTVAISVCDVTRPMPSKTVLPVLLDELSHIPDEQITILIATGTHRATTSEELNLMLGPDIVRKYKVVNHDAFDEDLLIHLGETRNGIPIWLNRIWAESDVRITTGFVEPHFFAGFSGGPKMVSPGLAGFTTTMQLHSARLIGHPDSTWGITEGNPVHDAIRSVAHQTGVDFSIDVTINREHQITSVYAGELSAVHQAACQMAKATAMAPVQSLFDLVVTTNSGYPLDLNLYQTVKGMSAAAQIVRQNGTIICAAECSDGVPDHGEYKRILTERDSPAKLLDMINSPGFNRHDQWQVQLQAKIQLKAEVLLKSGSLSPEQVKAAHLEPINDIQHVIDDRIRQNGRDTSICVLPQGPQTIPYVA